MVEGSKIDKAAHPGDAAAVAREALAYDEAVGEVISRAGTSTLVVSTSDHETGGVALGRGVVTAAGEGGEGGEEHALRQRSLLAEAEGRMDRDYSMNLGVLHQVNASTEEISRRAYEAAGSPAGRDLAASISVRERLVGELRTQLERHSGLRLEEHETEMLRSAAEVFDSLGAYGLSRSVGAVISARAKLGWTTWGHTGADVTLHASGPGSEALHGTMENSELGARIERMMGWDLEALTLAMRDGSRPLLAQEDLEGPYASFASWS